ncbi:hypothetical protein Anas_09965 [Armadillidium nasatum]|uniref:Dehydrogenase/reductase SDR family member 11 n=1 Tax=Armadillidium nasatum TaxID=96803 RepID=A0A5N5SJ00_9CRUS|nr:hypothetical protein Anas_09965 [Armadillidium nasatum]
MLKWMGRVALVTGASSGIGAAICEDLVKHGMKVVGAARREEKMQHHSAPGKQKPQTTRVKGTELGENSSKDVMNDVEFLCEQWTSSDATYSIKFSCQMQTLRDGTTEEWRQIIDVNVIAVCLCSKLTVKSIQERGLDVGHIINISSLYITYITYFSMAGHQVYPFEQFHFYTGSKFAVRALSEALRQEIQAAKSGNKSFGTQLVVSPGLVKTEVLNNALTDPVLSKMYENYNSLKSEDIARTVSQILSAPPYMEVSKINLLKNLKDPTNTVYSASFYCHYL